MLRFKKVRPSFGPSSNSVHKSMAFIFSPENVRDPFDCDLRVSWRLREDSVCWVRRDIERAGNFMACSKSVFIKLGGHYFCQVRRGRFWRTSRLGLVFSRGVAFPQSLHPFSDTFVRWDVFLKHFFWILMVFCDWFVSRIKNLLTALIWMIRARTVAARARSHLNCLSALL